MEIHLQPIAMEDKSVLQHLMELYLHDFSPYTGAEVNQHGLYGYETIDLYWQEAARHPYFIRVDGKLAGFVLVRGETLPDGETLHHIAEFFVLRKYRRQGIGAEAARQAFHAHPGVWMVFEMRANTPAQAFWRRVIGEVTGDHFTETEVQEWDGLVQSFRV